MEPMSPEPQGIHLPPAPSTPPPPPFGAPGGFGQGGYQPGGYQPGGYQPGGYRPVGEPPMYAPAPRPQRAGLATAAMVCGIAGVFLFWVFGILPILAIIFGFVSASTVKKSNGTRTGLGMARTGWILGVLGVAAFGVFIWAAATDRIGDQSDSAPVLEVDVGDCLETMPGLGMVSEVQLIECDQPHAAEVFHVGELDPSRNRSFPGETAVSLEVEAACLAEFQPFVGRAYNDSVLEVQYVQSSEIGWKATRGGYTCFVFEPGNDVVGTLRNTDR